MQSSVDQSTITSLSFQNDVFTGDPWQDTFWIIVLDIIAEEISEGEELESFQKDKE